NSSSSNRWEVLRCPTASSGALCCQDSDGVFWYRGRNQQLWRLVDKQFQLVGADAGLRGKRINALITDAKGRILVGTEEEIAMWTGKRFEDMTPTNAPAAAEVTRQTENSGIESPPPRVGGYSVNVSFLFVGTNEEIWVVSDGAVRKAVGGRWTF